jgi:hypothetical protein
LFTNLLCGETRPCPLRLDSDSLAAQHEIDARGATSVAWRSVLGLDVVEVDVQERA